MTFIDNSRSSHFAQATLCFSSAPEMPQIAFAFACKQLNKQFGQFWKKIHIYNFYVYHQIIISQFVEID